MATIYLIHFDQSFKHARHYIGFTTDLDARLQAHASGHGARLMEVITNAGINWQCVRTWPGERKFERQLKRRKETPALCPVCAGDAAYKRAKEAQTNELPF
jgi:predicted GIY-YIG superfamily endonuclease